MREERKLGDRVNQERGKFKDTGNEENYSRLRAEETKGKEE